MKKTTIEEFNELHKSITKLFEVIIKETGIEKLSKFIFKKWRSK